jgi:hypothetical protein
MEEQDVQKLIAAFKNTFETTSGKVVLEHLSKFCLANRSTYVPGDSHHSAFNEGARAVWLEVCIWLSKKLDENKQIEAEN